MTDLAIPTIYIPLKIQQQESSLKLMTLPTTVKTTS